MRKLFLIAVAMMLFAGAAYAGTETEGWSLMLQAGVNDESNMESRALFRFERFTIDLRGREADFTDNFLTKSSRCYSPPRLGVRGYAELTWDVEVAYLIGKRAMHGPVLNYTDRGDDDETVFAGWRVWIRGGKRHGP
jgi:hypothetical protein